MFLSLDIVGSTAFKNERAPLDHAHGDHWTRPFLSFYRMSADGMTIHWDSVVEKMKAVRQGNHHFEFAKSPAFWKGAGDEVLFCKTVKSPLDAMAAIQAMLLLMQSHREHFRSKARTARLDVKGTAWLAGFPLNNSEIVLAEDGSLGASSGDDMLDNFKLLALLEDGQLQSYRVDYIGPSVDLGFRLRDHATARRLMVSADLVWLLCHANKKCSLDQVEHCPFLHLPRINYGSSASLRGVLDSEPYPHFWIEASAATALGTAEDALLGRSDLPSRGDHGDLLRDYCSKFLDNSHPIKMKPYIPGCVDDDISHTSDERKERLRKLEEYVNGSAEQIETLGQADAATGGIPAAAQAFANSVAATSPAGSKIPVLTVKRS
jgi:hypothetical protein